MMLSFFNNIIVKYIGQNKYLMTLFHTWEIVNSLNLKLAFNSQGADMIYNSLIATVLA